MAADKRLNFHLGLSPGTMAVQNCSVRAPLARVEHWPRHALPIERNFRSCLWHIYLGPMLWIISENKGRNVLGVEVLLPGNENFVRPWTCCSAPSELHRPRLRPGRMTRAPATRATPLEEHDELRLLGQSGEISANGAKPRLAREKTKKTKTKRTGRTGLWLWPGFALSSFTGRSQSSECRA